MTSFNVMGFRAVNHEENVAGVSEQDQKAEPTLEVIYNADTEDEAKYIVEVGGFSKEIDGESVWFVAKHYAVEHDVPSDEAQGIKKSDISVGND